MKASSLRTAKKDSKKTPNYESRASIRRQNQVNNLVNQVAQGLGETSLDKLLDKYYSPEELPSPDVLTEMFGDVTVDTTRVVTLGAAILVIGLALIIR